MRRFLSAAVMSLCMPAAAWAAPELPPLPPLPLLPLPAAVMPRAGSFSFSRATIAADDAGGIAAARRLAELVARTGGPKLALARGGAIRFRRDAAIKGDEAYRLLVTPGGVVISAETDTGLFYGATTLWQLIAASHDGRIQAVAIDDAPAFTWRGVMLDSARHFQPPSYVKQLIDRMATEKLNVLHWHLTDDQGWRVQIDKYPRLTSVGAWRQPAGAAGIDAKTGRPVRYGGFYTKAEIREIVAYAGARHVTIVPEIEMPGHASAAIAAYPRLGVPGATPRAWMSSWGVIDNLFNTDDATFDVLTDILDEVIELFPSRYIHVGGDEAVKDQWRADPATQARMKALGLADETHLQGWFVARIADHLQQRGRRLIGWDEILDGKMPPSATVMSWHGIDGAITAAKAGHDAVLAPSPDFYLDHFQSDSGDEPPGRGGVIDWKHVYDFDTAPAGLTPELRHHLLGVQVNLWTEHVRTTAYADRMLWPRAAALAELGWTPAAKRDWPGFAARLPAEFARYRALGFGYDLTPLEPLARFEAAGKRLTVTLNQPADIGTLRYTVDGTTPAATSPRYREALTLDAGTRLRARAFAGNMPLGVGGSWLVDSALLRTHTAADMSLCSSAVPLRLEDDGATAGVRRVHWGDIFHPCWIWKAAPLDGVAGVSAEVGQVPFNFSVGADLARLVFDKPRTPGGELQLRLDSCTGPVIGSIPLGVAARNSGVSRVTGAIAPQTGRHDLCMTFSQAGPDPLWMLDRLTLDPGR
ncbi:MAG: beta-N-acetylhexosaminidase [Sphingomonas bacterium]|uniref:family 20 glycosylhydrolase n=1 Tax=Sphingomonas bacterium TaxID=1895847 RepID=UPI0026137A22|nr:family 20 glycosylhydrolase [Sphingomonas bacterium]MDB5705799.1 beta-N-acetylhexosaminidase [Sphingomonas bacterium]